MEEHRFGNPWIFHEIINIEKEPIYISNEERLKIILKHIDLEIEQKGEYIGIREMRKHICWYLKNLKDSSKVKQIINQLETKEEVINTLDNYFKTL